MRKEKFDIQGMTCSSCSAHVERAVNKLDGIKNVNVNLLLNNMIVEYDESKTDNKNIISAVTNAGYGAIVAEETTSKANSNKEKKLNNDEIIKSMKKRLII